MQTLPSDRQGTHTPPLGLPASAQRALAAAFASFTQTAGALETTYTKLQVEVSRLRQELENRNRKLAESLEENQRMRAYLASVVENMPCGVLVFDRQVGLRMMNAAARSLLKFGTETPSSSATALPEFLSALLETLAADDRHEQEWEVDALRIIGVTRAAVQTNSPGGDFLLIIRDLTEAKQLEREREASRRAQSLAEITALLAHEIRNPLGSLELFAGLLAEALAGQPELEAWINHVQAGLRVLAATVNNVLNFHGQPAVQLVPLDLPPFLQQAVDFLRPLAAQKGMQLAWRPGPESATVLADPARLQQAFLNLALNAFRAMAPGGTLTIGLGPHADEPGSVEVSFGDQGCGIPALAVERIFEPGFSTSQGAGLGLTVTRKVIEQHGGRIRVESRPGEGTTFTLVLPLAGAESTAGQAEV